MLDILDGAEPLGNITLKRQPASLLGANGPETDLKLKAGEGYFGDWKSWYSKFCPQCPTGVEVWPGETGGRGQQGTAVGFHICVPARSGCSKWEGLVNTLRNQGVLTNFQVNVTTLVESHTFKVAQVRNPIIRALSGWLFWRGIQEEEISKTGHCTNQQCGMPDTFEEALKS